MRAAVFLNGSPDPPDLLRRAAARADLVVAADGGALHALAAGVVPDLVVGDMDSLGDEGARRVEGRGASLERHPSRKDKMDGHLAVLAARERGVTDLDLLCAAGGRPGAVFALPHLLLAAERMGVRATVAAEWGEMFVVEDGHRTVGGVPGESVSVFPVSGVAEGVTLEGFEYPLGEARIGAGDTLGFHNELLGEEARVAVKGGALLVIHETRRDEARTMPGGGGETF
ncbi:MAG: Thiamin pyrophosphokinase [uncultured Rubrobacteraceae bacterium]|uniref:Thiamine diphosphokinase n=1 Tax=uncultured Rubrobacteraceae bacterium TaxID=349277 RepID=A0A6J4RB22_9ACTN|nr:MAG: Thiamin pyrophosphokinase [uncultured Rubrobacteraceae bacterium]